MKLSTIQALLAIEAEYQFRGQVIDSLMIALANCDTAFAIGFRGFEREREAWRACEDRNRVIRELNRAYGVALQRQRRMTWAVGGVAVVLGGICTGLIISQ